MPLLVLIACGSRGDRALRVCLDVPAVVEPEPEPEPVVRPGSCGDDEALRAALDRDHEAAYYTYEGATAAVFDDLDRLAERELCLHPDADVAALSRWQQRLPYVRRDDGTVASQVFALDREHVVFLWARLADSVWGGGGRATVLVRDGYTYFVDDARWRILGSVAADDRSGLSLVTSGGAEGWFLLVEAFDGNGAPPEEGILVGLGHGALQVLRTGEVAWIDRATAHGAVVSKRGWNLASYPEQPIFQYRWEIERTDDALAIREVPLTPWLDALEQHCAHHYCAQVVDRVERRGDHATVHLDGGAPEDSQVIRLERRVGGWRVAACDGRC